MRRSIAALLTVAIVLGTPTIIMLLVGLTTTNNDVVQVVAVLLGVAFGTFAIDIYTTLRED